jgi:hypothetical protein
VEGRLFLPRLGLLGDFSFLVDTGADATLLMPGDGLTLGLDYALLQDHSTDTLGAGGPISSYREPAWVAFTDGANLYGYAINLAILEYRADMVTVPTPLGRDVLHRWSMAYHHSAARLEFEIESADVVVPLSGAFIDPAQFPQ